MERHETERDLRPMGTGHAREAHGEQREEPTRKRGSAVPIPLFIMACALVVIAAGSLVWYAIDAGMAADAGATITNFDGMTPEEIKAELNRRADESLMVVSVAPRARITQDGSVRVNVENDPSNAYHQHFRLIQDGKVLHESGTIEPGKTVEFCQADGVHEGPATVEVIAVDPKTGKDANNPMQASIEIVEQAA